MRITVGVVALLLLAPVAPVAAEAGSIRLYASGGGTFQDVAQGDPGLKLVLDEPTASTPKVVAGHCDGLIGATPCGFTIGAAAPFDQDYMLGDGDPTTTGVATDFVKVHACINQMANTIFVSRMVYTVYLDGVKIGQRLNNALGAPTQAPTCLNVNVPINQYQDDQTPGSSNPDLGLELLSNGDLLAPAGSTLSVRVEPSTPFAGWWNYFYSSSDYQSGASVVYSGLLSDLAPAAVSHVVNLTEAAVTESFDNETWDTYTYNFTSELTQGLALFDFNVTNGNATVLLKDAADVEIVNTTINATGAQTFEFANATAGAWNLTIAYSGFNGTVSFLMQSLPEPEVVETETPEPTGNATTNETLDGGVDEQEAPGAALPLLLVGLIALVRRRK